MKSLKYSKAVDKDFIPSFLKAVVKLTVSVRILPHRAIISPIRGRKETHRAGVRRIWADIAQQLAVTGITSANIGWKWGRIRTTPVTMVLIPVRIRTISAGIKPKSIETETNLSGIGTNPSEIRQKR